MWNARWGAALGAVVLLAGLARGAEAQRSQERRGFWFGFGGGYGSLGCDGCDGREDSGTGYIKLGGTVSQRLLIGFEADSWVKSYSDGDVTLSVSNGNAVIYFYPSATGGFHLKAGLGVAVIRGEVDLGGGTFSRDRTGGGGMVGLGYDWRVGRNISLVPFGNFLGQRIDGDTFNFFQLGLGLTVH